MRSITMVVALVSALFASVTLSDVLDPESPAEAPLQQLEAALNAAGVDIAFNLNRRQVADVSPRRPRVGALADIPPLSFPDSEQLLNWEEAFVRGEIGALAFLLDRPQKPTSDEDFHRRWLDTPAAQRHVLSFHRADAATAAMLQTLLDAQYSTLLLSGGAAGQAPESGGRLFATAGRRWVVDSPAARDAALSIPEFALLGEALRRDSDSAIDPDSRALRRIASSEPAVFLKERLGDEFEASTIPEIIVPGGIAFGENAVLHSENVALVFADDRLWLAQEGSRHPLPAEAPALLKAAFDLAGRAERTGSDAIVDIDERGRVRLSSELKDTDLGVAMVRLDMEPFNHVTRLDVLKSVIIDTSVAIEERQDGLHFATQYEVRFLQSDRLRIARTQAALVYRYDSAGEAATFKEAWGPEAFRLEGRTDFNALGRSTVEAGRYAAWIALFRNVHGNALDFSHGRYEFLKLDKAGRATPTRM